MPLSPMAAEDIKDLQSKGVSLTPGQIVRLNELALQVENGPEAAAFCHAPRVAWLDDRTPIYEPTIQSELWIRDYALLWWCGSSLRAALAWSCFHAQETGFFDSKVTEKPVRKEIEKWFRGLNCTNEQFDCCLNYALNGMPRERPEPDQKDGQQEPESPAGCPYTDLLNEALAANLGGSRAILASMPRRVLRDIMTKWMKNQIAMSGGNPDEVDAASSNRAYCAYDDYLISITPKD